jgi:hypothetical protein
MRSAPLVCFALACASFGVACTSPAPPTDASIDQQMFDGASLDATATDGPPSAVTINEIRATDEDWIELFNTGTTPVDLSNWGVTDSNADGSPKLTEVARFPSGTIVAPSQFVLVLVDQADAGVGPQMRCLSDGGPMTCYHGSFGISASRGENLHLVAPTDQVSLTVNYPLNAAAAGESWGRLPNGTGPFARNRLTPGAPNMAP